MKDGKNIVSEAVTDAKALREAALQAAKNELVESLSPAIKSLLEKEIKGVLDEKRGLTGRIGMSQRGDYMSDKEQKYEESKEMDKDGKEGGKELDLESLAGFFPQMSEEPEMEAEAQMAGLGLEAPMMGGGIPTLGEGGAEDQEIDMGGEDDKMLKHPGSQEKPAKKEAKEEDEEPMEENIEISEAELKKVYEAALQTEVQVKKGFSDMTPAGELEDVAKDTNKGLNPEKKGDMAWEKGEAEDKKDWMVKEEVKAMIAKGLAENKALRENNAKLATMVKELGARLHETNLFNAKVLHVNRILNKNGRLTAEQKKVVLEKIDKAGTIAEVKMVYETIVDTFAAATQLSESKSRKPVANAQRARTSGAADQKVLSESVDHGNSSFARLQQLAGLVK